MNSFCHLHTHSQYSILDASMSIKGIIKKAKSLNMTAIALTDHGNLFGIVEFYKEAKEASIQPIIGCELALAPSSRFEKKKGPQPSHILLLAENTTGYKNLCKLSSQGYTEGFYFVPRIDFELLKNHSEGLICLTGCQNGPLAQQIITNKSTELSQTLDLLISIFPQRLYLELQRLASSHEDIELDGTQEETWLYQQYQEFIAKQNLIEQELLSLHKKLNIPIVATNNCHYLERHDWKAHEVLLNVQSGEPCHIKHRDPHTGQTFTTPNPKRETFPTHEYYFKSQEEMQKLFADIPQAISATQEIASRCQAQLDFSTKHYPVFIPPSLQHTQENSTPECRAKENGSYLEHLCMTALPTRYTEKELQHIKEKYPDKDPLIIVKERLTLELDIILSKGMADYLLIVWDFIHWAKNSKIPMGPGRGSGVGSIILYLIGITDIEPLRFDLFFERFINPQRFSYPDIDVDMCMDRRAEVINYTIQKYGKDNVAQIVTFGTMKAKMSVKDVGRTLNIPLAKVNQIAKLIPDDLNITLEKALESDVDLKAMYEADEETKQIIDVAKILEGSIRNTGIHAAGLIISGDPLVEHIPICLAKDSDMYVTQYSMKPVELVGMLKVDFLGLRTLTCAQMAVDAINARFNISLRWENLPLDDTKTYQLLNQGKTSGVFQIETGGMQDLARQLHLDRFEEIIAVLALYRPGPMDMIPSFIARKHGREPIEYDHPWMEDILKETYGIMVYQEQVMQIAQKLANYTLGEGDVLRRAMGKKDAQEMARQKEKFVQGALSNGIAEEIGLRIFEKMEKFAQYGFNKSHATAYGYLTYMTAYLKANYPGEWMAALMTCAKDDIEKVAKFMHEAASMNCPCLAPDINESEQNFRAKNTGIRFALSAIKGVGGQVVDAIVLERTKGVFLSLEDFLFRIDHKKVGKKTIELLIDAGCFDCFKNHRDVHIQQLEELFDNASKRTKEKESGVLHLFNALPASSKKQSKASIHRSSEELLFREKQLLGLFVSGHPLRLYSDQLKLLGALSLEEINALPPDSLFRLAFIIESCELKISSKSGKKFAILRISDTHDDAIELPIWPELFEQSQEILKENQLLWGVFSKEKANDGSSLQCKWLGDIKSISKELLEKESLAYDKAKSFLERAKKRPSSSSKTTKENTKQQTPEKVPPKKKVTLQFYTHTVRLSHIIRLKKLLNSQTGDCEVTVGFLDLNGEVSTTLPLPPTRQINVTKKLQQELEKIASFVKVEES